jgi:hypothetical protein
VKKQIKVKGQEITVIATKIIGTERVYLRAYEATSGWGQHSCILSAEGGRWGQVTSRMLPDELEALPRGDERERRVRLFLKDLRNLSFLAIYSAFPEASFEGKEQENGEIVLEDKGGYWQYWMERGC